MSIEETIQAAVAKGVASALAQTEGGQPLLLDRTAAARFYSVSPDTFDNLRARGMVPEPLILGEGRRPKPLWDRRDLVANIDRIKAAVGA